MANIHPLEALGDPTRRRLFERLRAGPCTVSELVRAVPVSQPAVSQHLRVLKEARLVRAHKKGQQRVYRLDPEGLAELRAYVEDLWEGALEAFREAAEQEAAKSQGTAAQPATTTDEAARRSDQGSTHTGGEE